MELAGPLTRVRLRTVLVLPAGHQDLLLGSGTRRKATRCGLIKVDTVMCCDRGACVVRGLTVPDIHC